MEALAIDSATGDRRRVNDEAVRLLDDIVVVWCACWVRLVMRLRRSEAKLEERGEAEELRENRQLLEIITSNSFRLYRLFRSGL